VEIVVVAAVEKLINPLAHAADEPSTPRRKRTGRVQKLYRGAGYMEAFDDTDAPWIQRTTAPPSTPLRREWINLDTDLEDDPS
jgi:hypothetical protein